MNSSRIDRRHAEWSIFALFVLAGMLGVVRALVTQDFVWVSNGLGWDGVHYDRLLKYFMGGQGEGVQVEFPFCGRIAAPWIMSNVFSGNVDFYTFNIVASAIFSVSFVAITFPICKGSLKAFAAAIAIPNFLFFAPIKYTNFHPAYIDPPFLLLLSIALIFIIRRQYHTASIVCLLTIPFREAALYLIPLISAFAILEADKKYQSAAFSAAIMFAGILIKNYILEVASCEGQSQMATALQMLYRFMSDPQKFTGALAAISMTLGPIFFVKWDQLPSLKCPDDRLLAFSLVAILYVGGLSIVGGSDITRIFYSFAPLYAPALIIGFAKLDLSGFALACLGWLITNQMINNYAQPLAELPDYEFAGYFGQFPDHSHPVVGAIIILIWLMLKGSEGFVRRCENAIFGHPAS